MMCTLVAAGEKVVELVVEKGRMLVLFPYYSTMHTNALNPKVSV